MASPRHPPWHHHRGTHHGVIRHQVHHVGDDAPLEQRVVQVALEDVAAVQQQRVRHGRLVRVHGVHQPADAAVAAVRRPAGGGGAAHRVEMRVDVVVVQNGEAELAAGRRQKTEEPQRRHHVPRGGGWK